jgi:hypothetical protein
MAFNHERVNPELVIALTDRFSGGAGDVETKIVEEGVSTPPAATDMTVIEYVVPISKPVKVAVRPVTVTLIGISTENLERENVWPGVGTIVTPFTMKTYEIAPTAPSQLRVNPVSVIAPVEKPPGAGDVRRNSASCSGVKGKGIVL